MKLVTVLFLVFLLASCSNPLKLLLGGGPNIAANTQAGQTNNQTLGTNSTVNQKLVRPQARKIIQTADTSRVKADKVETVVVNEIPFWVLLLLVLGWLLPSPSEIVRIVRNAFK